MSTCARAERRAGGWGGLGHKSPRHTPLAPSQRSACLGWTRVPAGGAPPVRLRPAAAVGWDAGRGPRPGHASPSTVAAPTRTPCPVSQASAALEAVQGEREAAWAAEREQLQQSAEASKQLTETGREEAVTLRAEVQAATDRLDEAARERAILEAKLARQGEELESLTVTIASQAQEAAAAKATAGALEEEAERPRRGNREGGGGSTEASRRLGWHGGPPVASQRAALMPGDSLNQAAGAAFSLHAEAASEMQKEVEGTVKTLREENERLTAHVSDLESRKRAPLYQKRQEEELQAALEACKDAKQRAAAAEVAAKDAKVRQAFCGGMGDFLSETICLARVPTLCSPAGCGRSPFRWRRDDVTRTPARSVHPKASKEAAEKIAGELRETTARLESMAQEAALEAAAKLEAAQAKASTELARQEVSCAASTGSAERRCLGGETCWGVPRPPASGMTRGWTEPA